MPGRYAGSLHSSLISMIWWYAVCILFIIAPHHAYAYQKATNFPTAQSLGLKTVCGDGSKEWVTMTCDGFPAFNPNNCTGHSVYSTDGHNANDDPATPPGEFRSYHYIPGNPNATGGYICRELAIRYFKFRWGINIASGPDQLGVSCTPPPGVKNVSTPVPGDVAVFSGCDDPFPPSCAGHIAVVDHYNPTNQTVTLVNQNFRSQAGYLDVKVGQATCYLHAVANPNKADTDNNTCEPGAGVAANCDASQTDAIGGGNKLCNYNGKASYCVSCSAQQGHDPDTFSFDGFPAFNTNHCLSTPDTWSTDGYNTYASKGAIPTSDPNYSKAYATDIGGGGYQCMEFGNRYFYFKYGIGLRGNPANYCDSGANSKDPADKSWIHSNSPVPGDLMMFNGTKCGINDVGIGHVAVVNSVNADGTVVTANQNWSSTPAYKTYPISCACTYLHAQKNANFSTGSMCSSKFRQEAYSLAIFNTGISGSIDRNGDMMVFARNVLGWVWGAHHNLPAWSSPPFFNHWTPFLPVQPPAVINAVSDPVTILHPDSKRIEFFYVGLDPGCELASIAITAATAGLANGPSCALHIWHDRQTHAAWEACDNIITHICIHIPGWWDLVPHHLQGNSTNPKSNMSVINFHGRTMLFYLDATDGNIWEMEDRGDNDWTDPVSLKVGQNGVANLSVIAVGNTIHIFYPGTLFVGGKPEKSDVLYVWHTYSNNGRGGWSKPVNMGDAATSNIAAAINTDGRLEIFYRGAAEEMRHMWQLAPGPNGAWNLPVPAAAAKDLSKTLLYDPEMGPLMTSDPAVATYVPNKDNTGGDQLGTPNTDKGTINTFNGSEGGKPMQVFFRGSDGFVWTMWKISDTPTHNGIWSSTMEISHEMVTSSPITVIPNNDSTPHVFFYGPLSLALDRLGKNLGIPGAATLMDIGTIIADPILKWCDLAWNVHQSAPGSNDPSPNYPGNWSSIDMIFGLINRNPNQVSTNTAGGQVVPCGSPSIGALDAAGLKQLQTFEGTIQGCYDDGFGNNTFGVGHLVQGHNDSCQGTYLCDIKPPQLAQCVQSVWQTDAEKYAKYVVEALKRVGMTPAQLTQEQFDALTDLCYNAGAGSLSTIVGDIAHGHQNDVAKITADFMAWAHPSVLTKRRQSDAEEYFHCIWKP